MNETETSFCGVARGYKSCLTCTFVANLFDCIRIRDWILHCAGSLPSGKSDDIILAGH